MSCRYRTLVTAHAGCEGSIENTVDSVIAGIEAGADIIEVDIRTSSDGMPVLIHNPSIAGPDGSYLTVSDHPYEALVSFARTHAMELTPLEDVLDIIREQQCMLNLDMKDIRGIGELEKRVSTFGLLDHVVLSGCSTEWARLVKQNHPKIQVLLNAYHDPSSLEEEQYRLYVNSLCRTAAAIGSCGINIDYTMCRPYLVDYARRRFLPVSVWTVDSESRMQDMLRMGVFAVTTYYPKKLRQLMMQDASHLLL